MKVLHIFVVALLLVGFAHAQEDEVANYGPDSAVKTITSDDFDSTIKSSKVVLVEFYAPWCGHCKSLKPIYEEAAEGIKESGLDAVLTAVDATEDRDLAEKFSVTGFPTIKIFKDGEVIDEYAGDRSADGIQNAVENYLLPDILPIDSETEVDKLLKSKGTSYILGHFSKENEAAQKAFREACAALRSTAGFNAYRCGEIVNPHTGVKLDMQATPVVRAFRFFEDEPATVDFDFYTEEGFNTDLITEFLKGAVFPHLAEISPENYETYERRGLPFVWFFHPGHGATRYGMEGTEEEVEKNSPEIEAEKNAALALTRKAAAKFHGKLSVVYLSGPDYADHAENMGANTDSFPQIVVQNKDKKYMWNSEEGLTAENLEKFFQNYLDGKVERHIKSEPVPTEEEQGVVRKLVAKNFVEEVYESDDAVFIEFYAPWCGHCKALAPVWEELATILKDVKGIKIAKMDAIANDVPESITGFPTMYLKKAGDKEHRLNPETFYDEGRTRDDFLDFLKKNTDADLSAIKIPANIHKLKDILAKFEDLKTEVERLITENAGYKEQLGIATEEVGDDYDQFDASQFGEMGDEEQYHGHDEL